MSARRAAGGGDSHRGGGRNGGDGHRDGGRNGGDGYRGGGRSGGDGYRGGDDGYRGDGDGYRGGDDGYRGNSDGYRGGRDSYRGGGRSGGDGYRGGRDSYRGGRDNYRPGDGDGFRHGDDWYGGGNPDIQPREQTRTAPRYNAVVVCLPGLEEVVIEELQALGVKRVTRDSKGTVNAQLSPRQLYAANMFLRSATRILVSAFKFRADTFPRLEHELRALDWSPWINPQTTRLSLRVTSHSSALYHTDAIEERIRQCLPLSMRAFLASPQEQRVVVRVKRDVVHMRIDSSGEPLHVRGWRQDPAKMPLRETLAAGVLHRSGWDGASPLIDPCCGAGTIAIEAALQACGAPPHAAERPFPLRHWPQFEPGTWASVAGEATAKAEAAKAKGLGSAAPPIIASDRDAGAVRAAQENAARAGVAHLIDFRNAPLSDLAPPSSSGAVGTVVSNLPWGIRSWSKGDLRNLHAALGNVCRRRLPGWGLAVLVADQAMARQVVPGRGMASSLSLEVSGVRAWLMTQSREVSAALSSRHAAAAPAGGSSQGAGGLSRGAGGLSRGGLKQSSSSRSGSEASLPGAVK
jgi:putative N6-adenine-specific DNA methylase